MTTNSPNRMRLASFEYLRVISAFGVVWFHMRDSWDRNLGYAGLFAFAMITVFLACGSVNRHSFSDFARVRFDRLVVPWVFWSLFYLSMRVVLSSRLNLRAIGDVIEPSMLLGGGHTVLWYLSFMYLVCLLIYGILASIRKYNPLGRSLVLLVLSTVTYVLLPTVTESTHLVYPFSQWAVVSPAVLFGMTAGSVVEHPSRAVQVRLFALMGVAFGLGTIYRFFSGLDLGALSLYLGALGFIFSLVIEFPDSRMVKRISACTLGIYVIHPCIVKVLESTGWRFSFPFGVIVAFCISWLCIEGIQKVRFLKRFV